MREEEEEPGDEPGGADSASGGQGASSAGAGRELCQSYASFLEANLDEGQGASPAGPLEDRDESDFGDLIRECEAEQQFGGADGPHTQRPSVASASRLLVSMQAAGADVVKECVLAIGSCIAFLCVAL